MTALEASPGPPTAGASRTSSASSSLTSTWTTPGCSGILAERSGAEVCALDALAPWLAHYSESMEADDVSAQALMVRHGIPREMAVVLLVGAMTRSFRAWGGRATVHHAAGRRRPCSPLLRRRAWRVHHRPGHSPSDTVFHDEASGELIAGDHLIKDISSNPLISRPLDGP